MICDCGGGTVVSNSLFSRTKPPIHSLQDITTYLISETSPQLVFEELCTGIGENNLFSMFQEIVSTELNVIGGKCGSTAIDRNLYALMSERFGNAFDEIPLKRKGPGSEFMKKFELVKRDFGFYKEDKINELTLRMKLEDPDPTFYDEDECSVLLSKSVL